MKKRTPTRITTRHEIRENQRENRRDARQKCNSFENIRVAPTFATVWCARALVSETQKMINDDVLISRGCTASLHSAIIVYDDAFPANTRRSRNVDVTLGQRRRRWPNI